MREKTSKCDILQNLEMKIDNTIHPKVSVIIPVYNGEQYIQECLDSVISQTLKEIEIICVNDGSSDKSEEILKQYAQKDNRIKVFTQKNKGLSGARNTGLDHITGNYVTFLDADDSLPPYALDCLYSIAIQANVPFVVSRQKLIGKLPLIKEYTFKKFTKHLLKQFIKDKKIHSCVWNKIYKAELLKNHRFIEGIYFEDWPFLMEILPDIHAFASTEIPCYIYRANNISITRSSFNQKKVDSYLKGIRATYQIYQNKKELRTVQKRMTTAIKMMTNKVYKSKNQELKNYTKNELDKLFKEKIIYLFDLPLKTLFRILRMKRHI